MVPINLLKTIFLTLFFIVNCSTVFAEQSKQFGPYTIHYSVVNTTFLTPKVAAAYNITRGKKRAMVNIAIREKTPELQSRAKAAIVTGRSWDLIQGQKLKFREIREKNAIYYIADVRFINEEFRWFEISVISNPNKPPHIFKFKQQFYVDR
tara:strand:+ start:64 stop:516 length:453 start_codon:yes stop_codon:yes gene_type:complete